ncbi:MAG: phage portal protein [Bilophila wadsworthia]
MLEVKPNLLDRLIAYVSPGTAARRMHARYCMAAAGGLVAGVRRIAGGHDGTLANWNPRRDQRLSESLGFDKAMLRADRARRWPCASCRRLGAECRRAGPAPRLPTRHVGHHRGTGRVRGIGGNGVVPVVCGSRRRRDATPTICVSGRPQHVRDRRSCTWRIDETPGYTFDLSLQLHPARLRTPSDLQSRTDIRSGVHLGERGQPKGYFIANPPENMALSGLSSAYFQYVPRKTGHRWSCLHRFHSGMPEEARGTSVLSPAMKQFRDLADYVDYELVGALIAASFTVFIETPADALRGQGGFNGRTGSADYPLQMNPGTVTVGQEGHKPHIISSARPGPTFDAFYERVLRAAAASTGQPYEMVAKDFSKTNYSSARAALLEVWKLHTLYQDWLIRGYLNCLWPMVLEEAWVRGLLAVPSGAPRLWDSPLITRAWLSCIWTRPPRGQIDPTKEREAEALGLASMTDTRTAICHGRGTDFETLAKTRQREERLLQRLGLKSETPAQRPAAGNEDAPQENEDEQ